MEVIDLPSVAELTEWMRVPRIAVDNATKLASLTNDIRHCLAGVYTDAPIGVWLNTETKEAALESPDDPSLSRLLGDINLVSEAVGKAASVQFMLWPYMVERGDWVKVAYSPFIRRAGELLNFFPGQYPGGIPNKSGPVASMLTSGLLGAGLGYGVGRAGEALLPEKWQKGKLSKTLAMFGGAAGVAPGAIWGAVNKSMGKPFNDNSLLNHAAGAEPQMNGSGLASVQVGENFKRACDTMAAHDHTELLKEAFGDSFSPNEATEKDHGPMNVNVDAMGRLLWESGASPETAGMTMGALAAARQMPGGAEQGFVTPMQMANLATHMGAGYLSGALVGATLGLLTGMPTETQEQLRRTGAYVGIVRAVIPQLFGQ